MYEWDESEWVLEERDNSYHPEKKLYLKHLKCHDSDSSYAMATLTLTPGGEFYQDPPECSCGKLIPKHWVTAWRLAK